MIKFLHVLPAWQAVLFWLPNFAMIGSDIPALFHWSQKTGYFFLQNLPLERESEISWMGYNLWVDQAWSIGAEIWFYAVSPLIVFGGAIVRPVAVMFASAALAVVLTQWLHLQTYYFWPAQIMYFALGILAYRFYVRYKIADAIPKSVNTRRLMILSPILWVLIFPLAGFCLPQIILFPLAAISIPYLFAASKDSKMDREVGNLSYGTYLNHMLILTIFIVLTRRLHFGAGYKFPVVLIASILFAFVTERLIEEPVEKIRRRIALG
jgi:peptidoglycan/LPS O-acetylase OafA/YrhL